jgi:xylose isomerase
MTDKVIDNGISKTSFHDDGDDLVIAHSQDVTAIIDANKSEYAQNDERKRWSDDAFGNKVASIPLVVFQELEKQGITRGFTVLDMPRFKAWLNNPDNRAFRTRTGRI